MLKFERFNRILVLTVMFSFFLWGLSFISLIFIDALVQLLQDTFLNNFIVIADLTLKLIFLILKYTSAIFFIGGVVGLIVVFINDLLINEFK